VPSPDAEAAVRAWRRAGLPLEVGWHPCLTLDRPLTPPGQVPSLVDEEGRFPPLAVLLRRLLRRQVAAADVAVEFRAQLQRFQDLVGRPPAVVNSHHHVQIFPPVGGVLCRLLAGFRPAPYVRRVREAWRTLAAVPGARCKRLLLSTLGRLDARRLRRAGFPGNDCLAGVTDPPWVADPEFLTRWLA